MKVGLGYCLYDAERAAAVRVGHEEEGAAEILFGVRGRGGQAAGNGIVVVCVLFRVRKNWV